jgi:hypothetical protein
MASMGNQNSGNHQASQDSKQIPYISVQDVAAKLDSKETNFIVVDVRDVCHCFCNEFFRSFEFSC